MASTFRASLIVAPLVLLACGGNTTRDPSADTGGTGAAGSTGDTGSSGAGAAGAGGAGSTAGPASASSGAGGGVTCGPAQPCAPDAYCHYATGSCGAADELGKCAPKPEGCPENCPGVCGCDGAIHCNECAAAAAGIDVSSGTCADAAEYSAWYWPGGLDHLVIARADSVNDLCVRIYADAPMDSQPGFEIDMPEPWGVSSAVALQGTTGCIASTPFPGLAPAAEGATGVITWVLSPGMFAPCTLDLKAIAEFAPGQAWLPASVELYARGIPVEGGCF